MAAKKDKKCDFEASLQELTLLVDTMEKGNLSLEASLTNFESGIKLIRECQKALTEAEQKVKILSENSDKLTEFHNDDKS